MEDANQLPPHVATTHFFDATAWLTMAGQLWSQGLWCRRIGGSGTTTLESAIVAKDIGNEVLPGLLPQPDVTSCRLLSTACGLVRWCSMRNALHHSRVAV